jgi:hypothetical protein
MLDSPANRATSRSVVSGAASAFDRTTVWSLIDGGLVALTARMHH